MNNPATVRIVAVEIRPDTGYIIINEEDFDPQKHTLWEEPRDDGHEDEGTARSDSGIQPPDQPASAVSASSDEPTENLSLPGGENDVTQSSPADPTVTEGEDGTTERRSKRKS